jgi:hypothetical protein
MALRRRKGKKIAVKSKPHSTARQAAIFSPQTRLEDQS